MTRTFCDFCGQEAKAHKLVGIGDTHMVYRLSRGGQPNLRVQIKVESFPDSSASKQPDCCFECFRQALAEYQQPPDAGPRPAES
jgi:hypothetical protein